MLQVTPPKSLLRAAGRAIGDFDMIRPGDRVLLGLSGGKDSLSLLSILLALQRRAPVHFHLGAITVDPMVAGFDPSPLRPLLVAMNIPYHYERQDIVGQAQQHMGKDSFCAFCARMKRGIMYRTAREAGYNVLALAQHLDDLAESFLMSAFYTGRLHTMRAHYTNDAGDLRVIRPLVYVRERQTAEFARSHQLPVIPDNCPACFRGPTEREHIKELLAVEERHQHGLFRNLLAAMRPLLGTPVPRENELHPPSEASPPEPSFPVVTVATFDTLPEAHIALGKLQSEGIPCRLADEHMGDYGMPASIAVGGIKLQVSEEDAGKARQALAADRSADIGELAPG
jgi:tRNA 2-thiocytidine biosynthesis protein TtcA